MDGFMIDDKKALRRSVINERKNMSEDLRRRYSTSISDEILSRHFETADSAVSGRMDSTQPGLQRVVCSYAAFRGEVDLDSLHQRLLALGHILLLPYVDSASNAMIFCEVDSLDDLCISPMGIPEPDPKKCTTWSYEEIWRRDPLVLTPGVAFTRNGDRMGYGGGFYDRFFEASQGRGKKIGICYRMQLRETLPTEPHDIRVDEVVYAPKKVLLGLSGGVDSAVAAHLLKEKGYEVVGAHLRMWKVQDIRDMAADAASADGMPNFTLLAKMSDEEAEECSPREECSLEDLRERYQNAPDVVDAYLVAKKIGIPLYSCDLRREFREEVVAYFAREYLAGRTPNPCTYCNRKMKFHNLIRMADAIGAEYIATGHYARICFNRETGRYEIVAPADRRKDQGYMLSRLSQEQLSRFLTPLSEMRDKAKVREVAAQIGLHISDKKDSQEICFVDRDYLGVLQELGLKGREGHFVLDGKVAGNHCGIEQYTIGQRKGLGAFGRPVFVVRIDQEKGDVVLGDNSDLFSKEVHFGELNYVSLPEGAEIGGCTAKIRYAAGKEECTVENPVENGFGIARFDQPQRAATPGQIIVFYDGDKVLASGVIEQPAIQPSLCSSDGKMRETTSTDKRWQKKTERDSVRKGGAHPNENERFDEETACLQRGADLIYLDAAATTYPRREVLESASSFPWYNPSSSYRMGVEVRKRIDQIKKTILTTLGARQKDLIFTSGGTESNNMAILSALGEKRAEAARTEKQKPTTVYMSGIDHASVNEAVLAHASKTAGACVAEIPVDRHGHLKLDDIDLRDAALVCITHVNNEIGTIVDVESLYRKLLELPASSRPLLFVDGVQALGKIPLADVKKAIECSDFYSISAHKIHGLKGVGALIANKRRLRAFHIGGGQEFGLRGGTENTPGIAAFGTAVELLKRNWNDSFLSSARQSMSRILRLMEEKLGNRCYVLNSPEDSTPFILSVSFKNVKSEIVIHSLAEKGILVSSASACSSTRNTLSRVIQKIGTEAAFADGTIRISLPMDAFYRDAERPLNDRELVYFVEELSNIVSEIQRYNTTKTQ